MIVIGRKPVLEYIISIEENQSAELLISDSAHGKIVQDIIDEAGKKGIKANICSKETLLKYHPSSKHQGVILISSEKQSTIPDSDFIADICRKKGVLVLLDQITDPHNAGSIIRTTEALGGDGIVLPGSNSVSITPALVKASAGATAHIRIINIANVVNFIKTASEKGYWIIGASDHGEADLDEIRHLRPAVLIIGSEGSGMRRLTEEKCHQVVKIPLKGKVSSLNASVAAGIILYEILKDKPDNTD